LRGGLLALSSNIGRYNHDSFAVVPEAGFSVGYPVTRSVRVYAGYRFLYLSEAVRPGDQIDRVVNPTLLPTTQPTTGLIGPARPNFVFKETDFWAQGIHCGLEFRY
jgi:Putative beta barrel porin-7 (BBP7)